MVFWGPFSPPHTLGSSLRPAGLIPLLALFPSATGVTLTALPPSQGHGETSPGLMYRTLRVAKRQSTICLQSLNRVPSPSAKPKGI